MRARLLSLMLVLVFVVGLTGCAKTETPVGNNPAEGSGEVINDGSESGAVATIGAVDRDSLPPDEDYYDENGVLWYHASYDYLRTEIGHTPVGHYFVNMPSTSFGRGGGDVSFQEGLNTWMFNHYDYLSTEYGIFIEDAETPRDIIDLYHNQIIRMIGESQTENYSLNILKAVDTEIVFTLESTEDVQVNDYQICRFTGDAMYIELRSQEERHCKVVGYATFLKEGDIPFIAMAVDGTEEQTKNDLLEDAALWVMKTMREEEPDCPRALYGG